MKLLKVFTITITLILAISQIAWAQTPNTVPTYDAVKDWATQTNPNGVWSYGYLTAWGAPIHPLLMGEWPRHNVLSI